MARRAACEAGGGRTRLSSNPAAGSPQSESGPPIYVASPLGFSEPGSRYLDDVLHPALRAAGFSVLDPWETGRRVARELGQRDLRALNAALGAANASLIERSDGVLAVLDGSDVDSGTAAEVGYAAARNKVVVGVRTDFRMAGDNAETPVNLQVMHFIVTSGGDVATTIEEAVETLGRTVPAVAESARLFHVASRPAWSAAKASGSYTNSTRDQSLAEVGFIHCSYLDQVMASAERFYADADVADHVVLAIDASLLEAPLVVEAASNGIAFPHIYGALNPSAVVATCDLLRLDGRFALGRAMRP